ncbi:MAG: cupredoxin domain-containing protein [Actinobacteria bacterium]|nr:cupredoxin domain-containing protein [Actinomycetota bacterium]
MASALLLALLAGCGQGGDEQAEDHEGSDGNATQTTAAASADGTAPTGGGSETSAANGGGHPHDRASCPPADATDTVKISMRDYAFVDMPATVTGPRVRIEAKNNGPSEHEVLIFDADGNEIAGTDAVPAGETAVLSAELPSGTYQLRCLVEISPTETHFDRGMRVTFAVM